MESIQTIPVRAGVGKFSLERNSVVFELNFLEVPETQKFYSCQMFDTVHTSSAREFFSNKNGEMYLMGNENSIIEN